MSLTPEEFINRYSKSDVNERGLAQSHFLDLCDLLGVPHPVAGDRPEQRYRFEQPVTKVTGGRGFADVWFQNHFGWEYKGVGADLGRAYQQLLAYREDLGNPPLLIVSDTRTVQVHTNFTGTQKVIRTFALEDILTEGKRLELRDAWLKPAVFNPTWKRDDATKGVINQLAQVADALKLRGMPAESAAQFLVKVVFTLFAQSVDLLPRRPFSQILEAAQEQPEDFQELCTQLFTLMGTGGKSWLGRIPHINGGVFSSPDAPALGRTEIAQLQRAATMDWAHLEPSIFGTLFERVIDTSKRSQLGAHYTPLQDILDVVLPVVITPLRAEWEALRDSFMQTIDQAQQLEQAERDAETLRVLKTAIRPGVTPAELDAPAGQVFKQHGAKSAPRMTYNAPVNVFISVNNDIVHGLPPLVHSRQMLGIEVEPFAFYWPLSEYPDPATHTDTQAAALRAISRSPCR